MWASGKSPKWCLSVLMLTLVAATFLAQQSGQSQAAAAQKQVKSSGDSKSNQPDFQEGPPTFKVTTGIVIVDVVARDKHGNPVRALTEKDFQVFEHLDWIRRVP